MERQPSPIDRLGKRRASEAIGHMRDGRPFYPVRPDADNERRALMIASKHAAATEAMHALLREGIEHLAERDRIADDRERTMLALTRRGVWVNVIAVAEACLSVAAAVVAIVAG